MKITHINPKSTQDFLEKIKTQGDSVLYIDGITIRTEKNVFPPEIERATSSHGLLDMVGDIHNSSVLDMGTGSGIQAIRAYKKGAKKVVAVDINKYALVNARYNFKLNNCSKIKLYQSDLFNSVNRKEKFKLILANLPFLDFPLYGTAEASLYDPGLSLHHRLLKEAREYMTKDGVLILTHANVGGKNSFKRIENMLSWYNWKIVSFTEKSARGYLWRIYKVLLNK